MMYEVRFIDNTGKFRVASSVPAESLEIVLLFVEKIAKDIWIDLIPGWLQ